jgi:L-aminopeptidase/D-esterase-like protein
MSDQKVIHVPGFKIGTAEDPKGLTGVTVILPPSDGAAAGVDVRGCAPGTRETDLLKSEKTVQKIHAVVLSGGSAFGLEAASGVMRYLSEQGVGFAVGNIKVPIVCSAVLFDLQIGSGHAFPDLAMGRAAAESAGTSFLVGCRGAGTGATVGKLLGMDRAMKSGAGYAELKTGDLYVGAYIAVNACGEIYNDGKVLAGARDETGKRIVSSHELMLDGVERNMAGANTTIGCIMTNAALTKTECNMVSTMAQDGYARAIRPVHTTMDGDTLFALASGEVKASIDTVGYLAEEAVRRAIIDAQENAESAGGLPAYQDLP